MARVLEKVERRLGEKLFLKGDRCLGPKCALLRRATIPGAHGKVKGKRKRAISEFGSLLREKQKIRFIYGLDDRDIDKYSKKAASQKGVFSANFLRLLESRLDNACFRLGFANSRRVARQMVGHGHVSVNGRRVTIPSFTVTQGDVITIREASLKSPLFADLEARIKNFEPPQWLELDKSKKTGKVKKLPEEEDAGIVADIVKIKEFYSR